VTEALPDCHTICEAEEAAPDSVRVSFPAQVLAEPVSESVRGVHGIAAPDVYMTNIAANNVMQRSLY